MYPTIFLRRIVAMSEVGRFINDSLHTTVPWDSLVSHSNLQTVLHAIVQRLDRNDKAIAQAVSKFA